MLASSGTNWLAIIAMLSILPRAAITESNGTGRVDDAGVEDVDEVEDAHNGNWETEEDVLEVTTAAHVLLHTAVQALVG